MTDGKPLPASIRPPPPDHVIPIPAGPLTDAFGCEKVTMIIFDSNGGAHYVLAVKVAEYTLIRTDRAAIEQMMDEFKTR